MTMDGIVFRSILIIKHTKLLSAQPTSRMYIHVNPMADYITISVLYKL